MGGNSRGGPVAAKPVMRGIDMWVREAGASAKPSIAKGNPGFWTFSGKSVAQNRFLCNRIKKVKFGDFLADVSVIWFAFSAFSSVSFLPPISWGAGHFCQSEGGLLWRPTILRPVHLAALKLPM